MSCTRACKILSGGEFVIDFYSRSRTAKDEHMRSVILVGAHAAYEVSRIQCLRACMLGVGGALQRCT